MALTATQKVTVAEIAQENYETVNDLASSLIPEQETLIIADIATWNENRNDVDVWLSGAQVNWEAQKLLDAIRSRVRILLGLPAVPWDVSGTSQSVKHVWVW